MAKCLLQLVEKGSDFKPSVVHIIYLKKVENVVSLTCSLCHLLFSLDGLKETATSLSEVKT